MTHRAEVDAAFFGTGAGREQMRLALRDLALLRQEP